jgi:AraC-like DNA-binding protein
MKEKMKNLGLIVPYDYKLLRAPGISPIEYLQNLRIESAKKQLEQTNQNINEIIDRTGYSDPKSFRKAFNKLVGMTPMEYREKFNIK